MNQVLGTGKYLFAIPFAVFGIIHFISADAMAGMAPFGGAIIIYITGLALLAASVSILIGKYDKLASTLLGVMLILFILLVHAKGMGSDDPMTSGAATSNILKDLSLAGAAWLYARFLSKDNSVIG